MGEICTQATEQGAKEKRPRRDKTRALHRKDMHSISQSRGDAVTKFTRHIVINFDKTVGGYLFHALDRIPYSVGDAKIRHRV